MTEHHLNKYVGEYVLSRTVLWVDYAELNVFLDKVLPDRDVLRMPHTLTLFAVQIRTSLDRMAIVCPPAPVFAFTTPRLFRFT